MVTRKLAAFFTMIAFILFAATWLFRRLAGLNAVNVMSMFTQSCVIIIAYFIIGIFLAKMGVALVNELLSSIHREEAERRERARNLYLTAISGGKPEGLADAEYNVEGAVKKPTPAAAENGQNPKN